MHPVSEFAGVNHNDDGFVGDHLAEAQYFRLAIGVNGAIRVLCVDEL